MPRREAADLYPNTINVMLSSFASGKDKDLSIPSYHLCAHEKTSAGCFTGGSDNKAFEIDITDPSENEKCSSTSCVNTKTSDTGQNWSAHAKNESDCKKVERDNTENTGIDTKCIEKTGDKLSDATRCHAPDANKPDGVHENVDSVQKVQKVGTSLKKWVTGTNFIIYVSHFLSAWGDRMWSFGIGLFLVSIASENLQLPAIYGLSSSITVFFLGALVGDWVDHTPRLKAAQLSLVLQNVFVVICVAGVYAYLWFEEDITEKYGEWLMRLSHAGIIIVGILSTLASLARMISVERDWIVEICGKDKDMLAKMTSSMRRIDQATLILAPIATGQIMTYAGLGNGAVFIAIWNVVSVFIEYYLMWKVYNTVPALRAKKEICRADETPAIEVEEEMDVHREAETPNSDLSPENREASASEEKPEAASPDTLPSEPKVDEAESLVMEAKPEGEKEEERPTTEQPNVVEVENEKKKGGCGNRLICSRFVALYRGWRTYMGYSVALAGMALACLYMTVLGFDNITVAYAVTQGVSESILGILMGASAVFGILGTFAYPLMRRHLGLVRTGIFALSCEVTCLVLCVVSVWMPGSPFDPLYYIDPKPRRLACYNVTVDLPTAPTMGTTSVPFSLTGNVTETMRVCQAAGKPDSYVSVGLLMAGIVLARFGLWIADLTITQLFLEAVVEGERGVVNGVQSSLNKLMDVLKFVLVVGVPDIPAFGYLIVVSFLFICLGWLLYAIFLRRQRGHFFHFQKCRAADSNGHDSRESLASVYSDAGEYNYGRIPVSGDITFGLEFDPKLSALRIHLKGCSDLAPVNVKRNYSDPYVKVYLLPDKTRSGKQKSKIKKHTLNPVFNETLTYNISQGELENRTLWLTVWHNDWLGRNDFLGEVTIPMDTYRFGEPSPCTYTLMPRAPDTVNEEAMQYKGDLVISLKYVTPDNITDGKKSKSKSKKSKAPSGSLGEIHAMIKSACNLTAARSNGMSDPFVKG